MPLVVPGVARPGLTAGRKPLVKDGGPAWLFYKTFSFGARCAGVNAASLVVFRAKAGLLVNSSAGHVFGEIPVQPIRTLF
jgi:hypothetical protein